MGALLAACPCACGVRDAAAEPGPLPPPPPVSSVVVSGVGLVGGPLPGGGDQPGKSGTHRVLVP